MCAPLFAGTLVAALPARNASAAPTPVLVLPYAPIYRSATPQQTHAATELLRKELENLESIQPQAGGVAKSLDFVAPSLVDLIPLEKDAEAAETARKIKDALAKRSEIIQRLKKNAAAPEAADKYVQSMLLLARAQLWAGDDRAASWSMEAVAAMAPFTSLDPAHFSRIFRQRFQAASKEATARRPGKLLVSSVLAGAEIALDGRKMGVAPLRLSGVVPGTHLLSAQRDGVPPYAAFVTVKARSTTKHLVSFDGIEDGATLGKIAGTLTRNTLDGRTLRSIQGLAKKAKAAYTVTGGIAAADGKLRVHTLLIDGQSGKVVALEPVAFDSELLTAESDVLKIVRSLEASIQSFSGGTSAIAQIDPTIAAQSAIAEVNAAPDLKQSRASQRSTRGPRKVFQPLKGGTIQIKDDEG